MSTVLVLTNHNSVLEDRLRSDGHDVVVVASEPVARMRRAAAPAYPLLAVPNWSAFGDLARIAAQVRGRVDQVATTFEGAMVGAGLLRGLLGLPGIDLPTAVACTDKLIMKERLSAAGVPVVGYRYVAALDDVPAAAAQLGWPVVLKPLSGFASTHTHVVHSVDEFTAMRGELQAALPASEAFAAEPAYRGLGEQGGLLVEQYVEIAEEYHVDGLWDSGTALYHLPGRYTVPPLQGMGGTLGSILLDPDTGPGAVAVEIAARAATALGLRDGYTHAEVLHTRDGRWLLGEIAGRVGGGGMLPLLEYAYGIDTLAVLAALAVGEHPDVTPRRRLGVFGWAGPAVPAGRVTRVATVASLVRRPLVVGATVAAKVGTSGGPTGSGLWGGLAGYVYLRGDTERAVLDAIAEVPSWYAVAVTPPPAGPSAAAA